MSDHFWFSDVQWAKIKPLLPTDVRGRGRVDDRRVLSGIVHALRSGGRWADCPRDVYGPKKTLYNRFMRWSARGVWARIFNDLAVAPDTPERLFLDSTHVKVHRSAGSAKGGLGSWYRPDERGLEHQAARHLRRTGPPACPPVDGRQRPRL